MAGLLDLIAARSPEEAGGLLSDYSGRVRGRLADLLNRPAGFMNDALMDVLPSPQELEANQQRRLNTSLADLLAQGPSDMDRKMMNLGLAAMIVTPRGKIPETRSDVNRLADRFERLLDDAGVKYTHEKSRLSPARYFQFENPKIITSQDGSELFKVRISDHRNIHGADVSVDPFTGTTFEQMIKEVQGLGVPIADRAKPIRKKVIDDATLEKIWGGPLNTAPSEWVDSQRANLVWSPKGYWTEGR